MSARVADRRPRAGPVLPLHRNALADVGRRDHAAEAHAGLAGGRRLEPERRLDVDGHLALACHALGDRAVVGVRRWALLEAVVAAEVARDLSDVGPGGE